MHKSYIAEQLFFSNASWWLLLPWNMAWYHCSITYKCWEFKTILIWRSSRNMNRNKNLLILYHLCNKLSKFSNAQKRFSMLHAISFQLLHFIFVSFCEINCIKIQTKCLVLNLSIFLEILSVLFTLTSSFASNWRKILS